MSEGAHTEAFLDAVTELYSAAEAFVAMPLRICDADMCEACEELVSGQKRLADAIKACNATGQIVQLTEQLQHGKVGES